MLKQNYTGNNTGNWNHFKITQKYLSNISGKQKIKRLQKNSHIANCTPSMESANVKVQNMGEISSSVAQIVNIVQLQHNIP
jgi:hypothetical protein